LTGAFEVNNLGGSEKNIFQGPLFVVERGRGEVGLVFRSKAKKPARGETGMSKVKTREARGKKGFQSSFWKAQKIFSTTEKRKRPLQGVGKKETKTKSTLQQTKKKVRREIWTGATSGKKKTSRLVERFWGSD